MLSILVISPIHADELGETSWEQLVVQSNIDPNALPEINPYTNPYGILPQPPAVQGQVAQQKVMLSPFQPLFEGLFKLVKGKPKPEEDPVQKEALKKAAEDKLVRVGPQEPPAKGDPLLRLPASITLAGHTLPPGYYLARINKTEQHLTLQQRGQTFGIIPLFPSPGQNNPLEFNPTQRETGITPYGGIDRTQTQITPAKATNATNSRIHVNSPSQTLTIEIWEGDVHWQTAALPLTP